jgi:uncharacterized protein YbjT (DUF2867 family)
MKLTIIAATGGVGRQLLTQALDAGHDVTAVARNPAKLPVEPPAGRAARIITAGIATPGTAAIIAAMRATGVRRIIAISASPVATTPSPGRPDPPKHDPGDGFIMRQVGVRVAKALFGKVYDDLARMEDVLRESGLDWTVLRPPQLTGKPFTGHYRTAVGQNVRGGRSIPRADVARYMLAVLSQPDAVGRAIGIAT